LCKRKLLLVQVIAKELSDFHDPSLSYPTPATFQAGNQSGTNTQAVSKLYLRQAQSTAQVAQIFRRHAVNCTISRQ
jgi:hypothetical protein